MLNPFKRKAKVTLYTTPGCADCAAVKRYLKHKGVTFTEKDVSQNEVWIDEMKRVAGVRIAPVTVVGEASFYGTFDKQKPGLEQALADLL
ncbi:glutaredoxin family protein [soil metagenome]